MVTQHSKRVSVKRRQTREERTAEAFASLRSALDRAGIVIPSLRRDAAMPELTHLGRVNPETAERLAAVILAGCEAPVGGVVR
ncbi:MULTISPECIES: hypothetical protein [Streptomyces]|uniref:hypothetical protein n=1 Tax=Streptomyces TaxID=1883 RepID=UPI00163D08E9|nr:MULTISPECIES: hypothetical protein [Streptomyces]MBC2876352.1 hypothetical protein [Streptomyces sp. TYQ1024]UBI35431.1 hypothetical protein K7I03_02425 [Streptomyces mobaraensis]UKW28023.1 hypothetical protein MCU78_02455 [Streptomyces sp. TYQ1024]